MNTHHALANLMIYWLIHIDEILFYNAQSMPEFIEAAVPVVTS